MNETYQPKNDKEARRININLEGGGLICCVCNRSDDEGKFDGDGDGADWYCRNCTYDMPGSTRVSVAPQEIDRKLATFMGLDTVDFQLGDSGVFAPHRLMNGHWCLWSPSSSIAEAFECAEKMMESGWYFDLFMIPAKAKYKVVAHQAMDVLNTGRCESMPEAICLAIIAAIDKK